MSTPVSSPDRYARRVADIENPVSNIESPTFDRPPLVEVALGIEWVPLADFGAIQMARLAQRWSDRYPIMQEHPPLPPNPPIGLNDHVNGGLIVNVGAPSIRLWLLTEDEDQLVQIQRDRLILNWRASKNVSPYPRYHDALRSTFAHEYDQFLAFVAEARLPTPRPISVEATYVNLIPRLGDGPQDLSTILRSQIPFTDRLGLPQTTFLQHRWESTNQDGAVSVLRLDVEAQANGASTTLNLSARSAITTPTGTDSVLRSMDVCHDEIVAAFVELTEADRQVEWGRTS
jgi:uncharacterized protein (TIGR04255 family)